MQLFPRKVLNIYLFVQLISWLRDVNNCKYVSNVLHMFLKSITDIGLVSIYFHSIAGINYTNIIRYTYKEVNELEPILVLDVIGVE